MALVFQLAMPFAMIRGNAAHGSIQNIVICTPNGLKMQSIDLDTNQPVLPGAPARACEFCLTCSLTNDSASHPLASQDPAYLSDLVRVSFNSFPAGLKQQSLYKSLPPARAPPVLI